MDLLKANGQTKKTIFIEDMEYIINEKCIPWEELKDKTILITGGTGLIGSAIINSLLYANKKRNMNITILAIVRDIKYAEEKFSYNDTEYLKLIDGTVEKMPFIKEDIHYIIHGASPTASNFFVTNPVETIKVSVMGMMNLLELAKEKRVKGFIYLSSMEVYGEVRTEKKLSENILGNLNTMTIRNSYPESKRLCELMCNSYAQEYGMQTTSIRLAQTFGPGISCDDKRVFAMIARCVTQGEDIVLRTKGESKRPYLYVAQAVTAILTVLLKGKSGYVYNASNPNTYSSVYEMAKMVSKELGKGAITVKIEENEEATKYPVSSFWNLDNSAIEELGWYPNGDLKMIYQRMMECM